MRGLLRVRRLDLGRLLRHARRPHRRLRRGRALRRRRPGRRPHDVLGPRLERLELDRAADARARAPDALVLVARNIHHSVINGIKAFGLDFRFLPDALRAALRGACCRRASTRSSTACARYPEAIAVLYTSPTYEGLAREHARDRRRRPRGRRRRRCSSSTRPGAGTCTSIPICPRAAMAAGADVCVQSTHKLAGGLQQTGLIHWREERVDSELMEEAYREYVTTSPSYHLLGSRRRGGAHARRARRATSSGARIDRTARAARPGLRARAARPRPPRRRARGRAARAHVAGGDLVKTTLGLSALRPLGLRGRRGAGRARRRDREGRRPHASRSSRTFQLGPDRGARHGARARRRAGRTRAARRARASRCPPTRSRAIDDRPVMHPYAARRYAKSIGHEVPLARGDRARWRPRSSRSIRPASR